MSSDTEIQNQTTLAKGLISIFLEDKIHKDILTEDEESTLRMFLEDKASVTDAIKIYSRLEKM